MYAYFVSLIVVVISSICRGLHYKNCNVVPKDQYIEVGSSATVVCQTSCVNGKIFWTLNSRRFNESEMINSTHTVLSLKNFTHHTATLECHSAQTQQVVGGTTIRTYTKPRKISCLLHYRDLDATGMDQQFTCTWEHQTNSSMKINYTVLLNFASGSQREICKSHVTSCSCKEQSTIIDIWTEKASIIIRATTAVWEADSDPYEFYALHIFKINYPSVHVTAFSDRLLVSWELRSHLSSEKYNCQVKYYKTSSSNEETPKVLNKSQVSETTWNVTIKEVESCMNYTVSVRCALNMAVWSSWSQEITVLSKLNNKHVRTHLWRKVAELGNNGKRNVHVMWVDVPPTCEEKVCYTVEQVPYNKNMTHENYIYTSCGNTACDFDVDQHAHIVSLTAFHHDVVIGPDSVYVPAVEEKLFRVTDVQASSHEGNIVLSWKAPDKPVSGYMIDWTHNRRQYYWKESKFPNATLFDLLDKKPYNITITPLLGNTTGHSTEATQICSSNGDLGYVAITQVVTDDKSANVRWNLTPHDACSAAVTHYKVFYQTQTGPLLNVTVDGKADKISLKDLNPNTEYSVRVQAISYVGNTTSKDMFFTTKRFDPRLVVGLSVFGSLIIFLVLSCGLYCVTQWKRFQEKLVPNPGLSSVGTWMPRSHQKGVYFQPFSDPPKDHCDQVYTEETHRSSTPSLAEDCNGNAARDRYTEVFLDPAVSSLPEVKVEKLAEPAETPHSSSPGESTTLIFAESILVSPYRSQSTVETPVPKTVKQSKRTSGKQPEKIPTKTVYVSLDMFEQGDDVSGVSWITNEEVDDLKKITVH